MEGLRGEVCGREDLEGIMPLWAPKKASGWFQELLLLLLKATQQRGLFVC